jgi:hypothetical protein
MADNDMTPQELASLFFAPSSEHGPEAAPKCVVCGEVPVEDKYGIDKGVCLACQDRARNWRPDPGPRHESPQPSPVAVAAYADYMQQQAEEDRRWQQRDREIAAHNAAVEQQLHDYNAQTAVMEREQVTKPTGGFVRGFLWGAVVGAIATAILLAWRDQSRAKAMQ